MARRPTELTIEDLAEQAGVSVRTVRYYIGQGLLAGPGTRGRAAVYGDEHLARLRLIRRLVEQHVPLAEQRRRLEGLSLAEVHGLLADEEQSQRALKRAEGARSPRDYVAGLLARARTKRDEPASPRPTPLVRPPTPAMPEGSAQLKPLETAPPSPSAAPAQFRASKATLEETAAAAATSATWRVAEDWQKWQLAPGIELHVRTDVVRDHSRLVERLLETARAAPGRDPGLDAAFPPGGSTD